MNKPYINYQSVEPSEWVNNTPRKYHKDCDLPNKGEIFVFGTALGGVHSLSSTSPFNGQAESVAVYGEGYFSDELGNHSYAIPVKNESFCLMPLQTISVFISNFIGFTKVSKLIFFVTNVGCGADGYSASSIAPMFRECGENVIFPETWRQYLD